MVFKEYQEEHKKLTKKVEQRRKELQIECAAIDASKKEDDQMQERRVRDEDRKTKKRAQELNAKSARMQDAL